MRGRLPVLLPTRFVALIAAVLLALAPTVSAQVRPAVDGAPRISCSAPVIGGSARVQVGRVYPGARIALWFDRLGDGQPGYLEARADAAGFARFEVPLAWAPDLGGDPSGADMTPHDLAAWRGGMLFLRDHDAPGRDRQFVALDLARPEEPLARLTVRFLAPSMLVTGLDAGRAFLYRLPLPGIPSPPEAIPLGAGSPGGAVLDGRGERIFVIADRASGDLRVIRPGETFARPFEPANGVALAAELRGIAASPDGRAVLVTGVTGGSGWLYRIDLATDEVAAIRLDDLGPTGGRVVVGEDGLFAFVAVRGLYVRQVDLLMGSLGHLLAVGAPGQDEVRDLRIVDGNLFALTGRALASRPTDSLTGLEVADLRHVEQEEGRMATNGRISVRRDRDSSASILLMDGVSGTLSVFDARTMRLRETFAGLPIGARGLVLPLDPGSSLAAVLEGEPGGASRLRPLDLGALRARRADALDPVSVSLGGAAEALAMDGSAAMGETYVLLVDGVGVVAVPAARVRDAARGAAESPIDLRRWALPLPDGFEVVAASAM